MAFRRDEAGASPLTVIVTVVIVAVLVTVIVYALAFDRPEDTVSLVAAQDSQGLHFDVTKTGGKLDWKDVTVRFLDRAGTDLSASYLQLPNGTIDPQDQVFVKPLPPAGSYLLLVLHGKDELARIAVTV